jgi:hypothetical protein
VETERESPQVVSYVFVYVLTLRKTVSVLFSEVISDKLDILRGSKK